MPGGPGGGERWFDENGIETFTPKSGSDNRDHEHDSVPSCTKQNEVYDYVLLDSDSKMSHNREIVTFDLTHLGSSQNRLILSHMRFQIHLDMNAKTLEPGFEVVGKRHTSPTGVAKLPRLEYPVGQGYRAKVGISPRRR